MRNYFIKFASKKKERYSSYFGHEVYRPPFFAAEKGRKVIQSGYCETRKQSALDTLKRSNFLAIVGISVNVFSMINAST